MARGRACAFIVAGVIGCDAASRPAASRLDTCDGVMPASLGPSVVRTIYDSPGSWTYCDAALTDRAGNVAGFVGGRGGPFGWTAWSPDGTKLGTIRTENL